MPRLDTEMVVEEAFKYVNRDSKILDMCTGSGCIIISLLKMALEKYGDIGILGIGADLSKKALAVAKKNNERLDASAKLIESNLFENLEGEKFDLIVSNPPYIKTKEIETLSKEVKLHDPFMALDGKEDGLYFYRRIIEKAPEHLNNNGTIVFEIGSDQGRDVAELLKKQGFRDIYIKKDLANLDRMVVGRYNKR